MFIETVAHSKSILRYGSQNNVVKMHQLSNKFVRQDMYVIEIIIFEVIFSNIHLSNPHYIVIVLRRIGEKVRIDNIKCVVCNVSAWTRFCQVDACAVLDSWAWLEVQVAKLEPVPKRFLYNYSSTFWASNEVRNPPQAQVQESLWDKAQGYTGRLVPGRSSDEHRPGTSLIHREKYFRLFHSPPTNILSNKLVFIVLGPR